MSVNLSFKSLRCTAVNVPLANPIRNASVDVTHAPLVLLDLLTQEGVEGRAYIFTYSPLVLKPVAVLIQNMAEMLEGAELAPFAVEQLFDAKFRLLGNTGLVTMAMAAIDMAIWDAMARAANLPLVRLLGGKVKAIPAYFSQGLDGKERGMQLAHQALELGFKAMKIKTGYASLEEDISVVRAVQSVLGKDAQLFVDYNQSQSVPEAIRRCTALDELGLGWIEEPTRQDDYLGHAKIALAARTPIQLGENWYGSHEMAKSVAVNGSDLVMPDVMKIGGVSGWMRAASIADAARLPMSSHLFHEVSAHLLAVTRTAHWLEYLNLADPILAEPASIKNGAVELTEEPGTGLSWYSPAVEKYRI